MSRALTRSDVDGLICDLDAVLARRRTRAVVDDAAGVRVVVSLPSRAHWGAQARCGAGVGVLPGDLAEKCLEVQRRRRRRLDLAVSAPAGEPRRSCPAQC